MTRETKYLHAIVFAVQETKPQIVKLPYIEEQDIEWPFSNVPSHKLDYSCWFERQQVVAEIEIKPCGTKGLALGHTLLVLHFNVPESSGEPLNRCVEMVTEGQCRGWRGNILVVRAVEPTSTLTQYSDVTIEDVESIIAWIREGSPEA